MPLQLWRPVQTDNLIGVDEVQTLPRHNAIILVRHMNARVETDSHNASPKVVVPDTLLVETNENGERLVDMCLWNNMALVFMMQPYKLKHICQSNTTEGKTQIDHTALSSNRSGRLVSTIPWNWVVVTGFSAPRRKLVCETAKDRITLKTFMIVCCGKSQKCKRHSDQTYQASGSSSGR